MANSFLLIIVASVLSARVAQWHRRDTMRADEARWRDGPKATERNDHTQRTRVDLFSRNENIIIVCAMQMIFSCFE